MSDRLQTGLPGQGKVEIFFFFPGQGKVREFYDIAIKKSGKGQGIVKKQCSQYCNKVGTHKNQQSTYN